MNIKKPLIFLGIFILMAVFYYFYEYKGGQQRQEREELGKKVLVFSPDSLESFNIVAIKQDSSAADTVSLSMAQGRWRLNYPVAADTDSQAVARLFSAAANASMNRVVEDSAGDLSMFGLEEPRLTFEVLPLNAETPLRLFLGNKNPDESYIYAANSERPHRVILLNTWLFSDLHKSPHDLRDKKVLHFQNEQVEKLVLETAGKESLRLEREEGDWYLRAPLDAPADRDSVKAILKELEEAQADSFIDDPAVIDPKTFGLSPPSLILKLFQENEQAVRLLYIGKRQSADGPYYARREGQENVCLVEEALVNRLTPETSSLRDRRITRTPKDAITRFRLEYSDRFVAALKSEKGDWSLIEPDSTRADDSQVDGLLWDLKNLQAVSFVEELKPSLQRAFENPFLRLGYETDDSSAVAVELTFAGSPEQDLLVYVRVSGRQEQVAAVETEKTRGLMKSFHDLRYKKILDFDTGEIRRIRLEYEQDTLELAKKDDKWLLVSAEEVETKEWKVQNLLWDLSGMEFTRVLSPQAARRYSLGLESPALRVSLWSDDKQPVYRIAFADSIPDSEEIHLSVEEDHRVFAVEQSLYRGLPKSAGDLKKEE